MAENRGFSNGTHENISGISDHFSTFYRTLTAVASVLMRSDRHAA